MTPEELKKQRDEILKEKLKDPEFRRLLAQSMYEGYLKNARRPMRPINPLPEPSSEDSG